MKSRRIYSVEHDTVCHRCHGNGFITSDDWLDITTPGDIMAEQVFIGEKSDTCDECNGTGVIQRPAPEQERP